jgi:hypothetical protein
MRHPKAFRRAVSAVILVNCGLLVWARFDHRHEELLERIELACLAFFLVEQAVLMRAMRWAYFRNNWCRFDMAVIGLSLLPVLGLVLPVMGADTSLLRAARVARLFHLSRHLTHLRLVEVGMDLAPFYLTGWHPWRLSEWRAGAR